METTDNNRQSLVDQQLVQKHLSSRTVKNKVFKLIFLVMYIIRTCRTYCVVNSNID